MSDPSRPVLPDAILGPVEAAPPIKDGEVVLQSPGIVAGLAEPPGGAAVSKKSRDTALIAQRDARIRKKATDIVLSALRAPETAELPENALQSPPPGWTKKQLRIALDATNSMKAAPAYLGMAQRVLESYKKSDAEKAQQPVINAELITVTVNQQVNNYPVRVLEED